MWSIAGAARLEENEKGCDRYSRRAGKCAQRMPAREGHGTLSGGYLFPGKKQHLSEGCWSSLKYLPHWCHGSKETVHNTQ